MSCIFILLLAFSCCCVLCNGARGPDRDRYSARRNSSLGEGERPREPRLLRVFGLARTLALPGLGCEVRKTHGYSLVPLPPPRPGAFRAPVVLAPPQIPP